MKILFSSYAYAPGVGGIETVSALLAREFVAAGDQVVLATETPARTSRSNSFEVVRHPTLARLGNLVRWCDVVFQNNISLGRLVSDKGADVLLRALEILKQRKIPANLTIVGRGPEEENLRALVRELSLDQLVTFAGEKVGRELAELMNHHQFIVIPSRWPEP